MTREDLATILIFAIVVTGIAAVVVMRHLVGMEPISWIPPIPGRAGFGVLFAGLAVLVCTWNVYLTCIGPWLYKCTHGGTESTGGSSGLPVISGFFVLFAAALLPPSSGVGVFLLAVFGVDPNGLPMFFVALARGPL
ncbi:MAG: hypothetical protein OEY97_02250 [Nitrospirota bacterium]|nr:hypothetical protein [Nitrospirota bacterium]